MSKTNEHIGSHEHPAAGRLTGKVALVTGGGTGIGRAAALGFAREGAAVVVAGRRAAELQEVVAAIEAAGGRAAAIPTDVADPAAVAALIAGTVKRFGRLDAAFNNAGIEGKMAPIAQLTVEDFDRTMAVNLRGTWLLVKHEVEAMLAHGEGGAIVNTSSFLAVGAVAGSSIYSASKAGLDAMIRAVAIDVGPAGIRINNVSPGAIATPMFERMGGADVAASIAAFTPLKRVGTPEEVGDVAVWLCTPEARFVTGQSVLVDGGLTIAGMR